MALSDGDYGGAFGGGGFGDLLSPAFGQLLATDPESAIPLLVQAGVDPNDYMKFASLGTGAMSDAGGGAAPFEAGFPESETGRPPPPITPTEAVPTSEPYATASDSLELNPQPPGGMPQQGAPPAVQPPAPVQEASNPWDLMKIRFLEEQMRGRTDFPYETPGAVAGGPEPLEAGYPTSNAPVTPGFWDRLVGGFGGKGDMSEAGQTELTTPTPGVPAAPGEQGTPSGPGAIAAPAMGAGSPFNTYGQLGGLYPLATPPSPSSGTTGGLGGPGIPLPSSDPRRTGIAGPTGASGQQSSDTIKKLGAALAGVKMPPQPQPQALRPAIPSGASAGQGQNSLIAMLTQLLGGGGAGGAAAPLRLNQAIGK